jgi:hypothetical protein
MLAMNLRQIRQRIMPSCLFLAAALVVGGPRVSRAGEAIPYSRVVPLFAKHCFTCHGKDKQEAELRIDKLDPDFVAGHDGAHWREVLDRLNFGDMPPDSEPALKKEDRELMTAWIDQERRRAAVAKNDAANFRRLTRFEYERTLQELLGLRISFARELPDDGYSEDGFRNDGETLRVSPLQYETYLKIADAALNAAIVSGPEPVVHRYRLTPGKRDAAAVEVLPRPADRPGDSFQYARQKDVRIEIQRKFFEDPLPPADTKPAFTGVALPDKRLSLALRNFDFSRGEMRLKFRVARAEPEAGADAGRAAYLTVGMSVSGDGGASVSLLGDPIRVDHGDVRDYEFRVRTEGWAGLKGIGINAWNSAKVLKGEKFPPRLKIESVELVHPYLETWPPPTHTAILFPRGDLPEAEYAREVVRRFATRAYRGPLPAADLDRLVRFWTQARAETKTLEESLRETLSVVLTSPRFLGLPAGRTREAKEPLTDRELASRLAYFLWSTMPDETLLGLAEEGKLNDPAVRSAQVHRLIHDPRAWAFIEQYADQWLDLDGLKRVMINEEKYPGFDAKLAAAMRLETVHFFAEVLRGDLSIFQFIDSDFTCVNETLADHYGIPGVSGHEFRKVKLDDSHHRGGILTQAAILTGNSDGIDSHPIKRGMWLLKNFLDEVPPPPPPNVPTLDRDQPAAKNLTIPQALALHRTNAACAGCHRKIDPWGLAFEEYDAVGNWQRDGAGAALRLRRTTHPIEAETELPTGAAIGGMRELKAELVRAKADSFRRAMIRKMMAYALGRTLTLGDQEAVDAIVPALRERGDGLTDLIDLIVASEPFRTK